MTNMKNIISPTALHICSRLAIIASLPLPTLFIENLHRIGDKQTDTPKLPLFHLFDNAKFEFGFQTFAGLQNGRALSALSSLRVDNGAFEGSSPQT
jgi:hypothetical protein